jgi:hypothetical protein
MTHASLLMRRRRRNPFLSSISKRRGWAAAGTAFLIGWLVWERQLICDVSISWPMAGERSLLEADG